MVFPNRRAGLFFREILSRDIHEPGWSPRLLTFSEFHHRTVGPAHARPTHPYLHVVPDLPAEWRGESFQPLLLLGELLLEDFNEMNKSLVRADDLFANLRDLKVLDAGYDYLTPEQRELVARFWQGFNGQGDQPLSPPKQAFLTFWNVLNRVYEGFRTHLQARGLGYEGMMTRAVAESLGQLATDNPFPRLAFVGFNAFYAAEEQVVRWFVRQAGADAFWDVDAHYLNNPVQEAGQFFRRYRKHLDPGRYLPDPLPQHFYANGPRDIQMVGVPLEVGQAKLVGNVLQELINQGEFVPERTAIVLPDQQNLLFPVLHALPAAIRRVNVTMGYPLRNTSLYSLVEQLLRLQEGKRLRARADSDEPAYEFHHTAVLAMLRHPYVNPINHAAMQLLIRRIEDENRIYLRPEELHRTPFSAPFPARQRRARDVFVPATPAQRPPRPHHPRHHSQRYSTRKSSNPQPSASYQFRKSSTIYYSTSCHPRRSPNPQPPIPSQPRKSPNPQSPIPNFQSPTSLHNPESPPTPNPQSPHNPGKSPSAPIPIPTPQFPNPPSRSLRPCAPRSGERTYLPPLHPREPPEGPVRGGRPV